MKKLTLICAMFLIGTLVPGILSAQETEVDAAKMADINKYLALSGYKQAMLEGIAQVAEANKQNSELPPEFWTEFQKRFSARSDELVGKIAIVYGEFFTHEEIRQILAFYQTDAGAKLMRSQGAITQRVQEVSEKFGAEIGEQIGAEMESAAGQ